MDSLRAICNTLIKIMSKRKKVQTTLAATSALSENPALLTVLAEKSFDSIILTDSKDGLITFTNAAFTALTGWAASEVIGKTPKLLQGEATDAKVIARLTKALKDGGEFEGSAINYRKDGTPFIMCVHATLHHTLQCCSAYRRLDCNITSRIVTARL